MVLDSIRSQGKLDDALEARILAADSKARLEDIYLPYKPKRRTKAMIARENGLEPLADALLADPTLDPTATAAGYVDRERPRRRGGAGGRPRDPRRAVLRGRRPDRRPARAHVEPRAAGLDGPARARRPRAPSSPTTSTSPSPSRKLPSHRILAVFRGEKEDVLDVTLDPGDGSDPEDPVTDYERTVAAAAGIRERGPRAPTSGSPSVVRWAWRTRILLGLQARPADAAAARSPRRRRSPSSPRTCATCCSPPRPAPAPRWASTRACAPASRSRSSTPRARSSPRTRSTRTSRAATGTARSPP